MKLLDRPVAQPLGHPEEALIREAHRRRRRRRLAVSGIAVAVVVAAVGAVIATRPPSRSPKPTTHPLLRPPPRPTVDATAFSRQGNLAFVSRGSLWVLDGSTKVLVAVRAPGLVPSNPSFSPDGKWLAFVASVEVSQHYSGGYALSTVVASTLWMSRANGTGAHPIKGLTITQAFGWSPGADLYSVSAGSSTRVPFGTPTAVDLVSPDGSVRQLAGDASVTSAVWSPDGSALAVSTESGFEPDHSQWATLTSYPVDGGPPTVWERLDLDYIVPTGWWPTWGIGYTTVGSGAVPGGSGAADGSPFFTVAQPGARPRLLGATLENESTGPPTGTASGWLAFVQTTAGLGRSIWQGKQVVVCSPLTSSCSPVPHPAGAVTLDPTWSPSGATLAYVQAPADQDAGFPQQTLNSWYGAHELRLYQPSTGGSRTVSASQGSTVPFWSADGSSFLYVSDDSLWLHPADGVPVRVASPLYATYWPSYYGQVPFAAQFTWSQAAANETACLSRFDPQC
jgi:hypothetical protein